MIGKVNGRKSKVKVRFALLTNVCEGVIVIYLQAGPL
jgi:hypothetical protein